jgi:hypothetical protein
MVAKHCFQGCLHDEVPSETLYRVALVRTDVSENVSSPTSGLLRVIPQLCCRGIAVNQPPHRGTLCRVEEHCLLRCFHKMRFGTSYRVALVRTDASL